MERDIFGFSIFVGYNRKLWSYLVVTNENYVLLQSTNSRL